VSGVKGKKRKQKTEPDNRAQSERFIRAAREIGAVENEEAFTRALDAVLKKSSAQKATPAERRPKPEKGK
jgi:hypothetical protein